MVGVEVADDDRLERRPDRPARPAAGTSPGPRSSRRLEPRLRSRYEAPVAPGRSVYAGPAPMTSSRIEPIAVRRHGCVWLGRPAVVPWFGVSVGRRRLGRRRRRLAGLSGPTPWISVSLRRRRPGPAAGRPGPPGHRRRGCRASPLAGSVAGRAGGLPGLRSSPARRRTGCVEVVEGHRARRQRLLDGRDAPAAGTVSTMGGQDHDVPRDADLERRGRGRVAAAPLRRLDRRSSSRPPSAASVAAHVARGRGLRASSSRCSSRLASACARSTDVRSGG